MPIYTYQCPSCDNKFELRQGWDAVAVAPCPSCEVEAKRLLVVPSVIFKGRGWYSTDSKRASHAGMVGSGGNGENGGGSDSAGERSNNGSDNGSSSSSSEPKVASAATE